MGVGPNRLLADLACGHAEADETEAHQGHGGGLGHGRVPNRVHIGDVHQGQCGVDQVVGAGIVQHVVGAAEAGLSLGPVMEIGPAGKGAYIVIPAFIAIASVEHSVG